MIVEAPYLDLEDLKQSDSEKEGGEKRDGNPTHFINSLLGTLKKYF